MLQSTGKYLVLFIVIVIIFNPDIMPENAAEFSLES